MHRKMIEQTWDERPADFMSLILENYVEDVAPNDVVWFLGDMLFNPGKTKKWFAHIMRDLPGVKLLVRGNHDMPKRFPDEYWIDECGFESVYPYFAVRKGVLLSHFPMIQCPDRKGRDGKPDNRYFYESLMLQDEFKYRDLLVNLHGHTHTYCVKDTRCMNVGVDIFNMRPTCIDWALKNKTRPFSV